MVPDRVVQELVNNANKYAQTKAAAVLLMYNQELNMPGECEGFGFDKLIQDTANGIGIKVCRAG
ncbi:MAG: hypothetical protein ABJB86_03035 [Bacteroidota bacterium]